MDETERKRRITEQRRKLQQASSELERVTGLTDEQKAHIERAIRWLQDALDLDRELYGELE
jgi:transcription initiation factor TFIIIB Brf1 subunit/transcription initiation factor TFIIB